MKGEMDKPGRVVSLCKGRWRKFRLKNGVPKRGSSWRFTLKGAAPLKKIFPLPFRGRG
jgi:hypothetical protein